MLNLPEKVCYARNASLPERVEEVESATIERQRLWNDRRDEQGPFDIIGDVHGSLRVLDTLLDRLGYDGESRQHRRAGARSSSAISWTEALRSPESFAE